MSLLDRLRRQRGLHANCPRCGESFRLSEASLFDATKPLPPRALRHLEALRRGLDEDRLSLAERRRAASTRPRTAAETVNIGKVVEKIAPSLPGFPASAGDCRSLLEPIDYVVFEGLTRNGRVDALHFVEAKSGQAQLTPSQRMVKKVVQEGKVSLVVMDYGRSEP